MKRILVSLFLSIFLICCKLKFATGIVVDKYIEPAHYETTYVWSGKVLVPMTSYVEDIHYVIVQGEYEGKIETETVYVDRYDYEKDTIGQKVTFK